MFLLKKTNYLPITLSTLNTIIYRPVLTHWDTGGIPVSLLLIIHIGPTTLIPHKGLDNIINDKQKKKSLKIF